MLRNVGTQTLERVRRNARRRAIERDLQAVIDGRSSTTGFCHDEAQVDATGILLRSTAQLAADHPGLRRLVAALASAGTLEPIVDGLAARDVHRRAHSARVIGALRLEDSVAWLVPLLASRERTVVDSAARALGRIGGVQSAEALIQAIQRFGPRRVLIAELAHASPDLLLESVLVGPRRAGVTSAAALAAGLRLRQTAVGPLLKLVIDGGRRHRVISCRALGWMGARTAIPVLESSLRDRDWRVRVSAAKALGRLHAKSARPVVSALLTDGHPKVRAAAAQALLRLQSR